jgi:hypothetical protein
MTVQEEAMAFIVALSSGMCYEVVVVCASYEVFSSALLVVFLYPLLLFALVMYWWRCWLRIANINISKENYQQSTTQHK